MIFLRILLLACLPGLLPDVAAAAQEKPAEQPAAPAPDARQRAAREAAGCAEDAPPECGREPQWSQAMREDQAELGAWPAPADAPALRAMAARTLDRPEFGSEEQTADWRWTLRFDTDDDKPEDPAKLPDWLRRIGDFLTAFSRGLGTLGHVLLWLLLAVLLFYLWRHREKLLAQLPRRRGPAVQLIAGIDIAPLLRADALPDDVVSGARHLWAAGHARDALSLLYRAALNHLGERLAFAIPESGTEPECLALVERHADRATTGAFRQLVFAWMQTAWQHRPPASLDPLVEAYRAATAGSPA